MKIAIPTADGQVAPHLGHCPTFLIADVEDGAVKSVVEVPSPGHGPGGPPPFFLVDQGVTHVVAHGMPDPAINIFARFNIEVTRGATGDARKVLADFLAGNLELTDEGLDGGPSGCSAC